MRLTFDLLSAPERGLAALLVFLTVSCGDQTPAAEDAEERAVTGEDVARETNEAIDEAAALARLERDRFLAEAERNLDTLDRKIEELRLELENRQIDERWRDTLAELESRRAETAQALERLRASSRSAWADLRNGFDDAVNGLRQSVQEAEAELDGEPAAEQKDEERRQNG